MTVDWEISSVPVTRTCAGTVRWTMAPAGAAAASASRPVTQTYTRVPGIVEPDGSTHCFFHRTLATGLRAGEWRFGAANVGAATGDLWSASCDVDIGKAELATVTFAFGEPRCTSDG